MNEEEELKKKEEINKPIDQTKNVFTEPDYIKPLQEPIQEQPIQEHEPEPIPEETQREVNVPSFGTVEKEMYYVRAALNEQQKRVLDFYIQTIMNRIANTKRKSFVVGVAVGGLVGMAGILLAAWSYVNFFI